MVKVLVELGSWGKKYKGDFIAGAIAFLVPFLITWAIKGFYDIVTLTSLFGSVFLIAVLILGHPTIFSFLLRRWRKSKFRYPIHIGTLSGYITNQTGSKLPNKPFTEYEPKDWYDAFSSNENFVISWVSASEISDEFDIIINPFGEEYPEIDKPNRATLRRIVRFVKEGGVFVNVAGLAFYYLWDGDTEDLSGPLYETYQLKNVPGVLERIVLLRASHLLDSSLYRYFGVRTTLFNDTVIPVHSIRDEFFEGLDMIGGVANVKEFRSAYRSEKEEAVLKPLLKAEYTIIDPLQDSKPITFACYPIAAVKLGKGYLILNGIKLEKARPQDFAKEVEAILRVAQKLNLKGIV